MKKSFLLFLSLILMSSVCYSDPVHVFKDDFDSIKKEADAGDPRKIKSMIDLYKSGFYYGNGETFKADKSKARYYELLAKNYGVDPYREEKVNRARSYLESLDENESRLEQDKKLVRELSSIEIRGKGILYKNKLEEDEKINPVLLSYDFLLKESGDDISRFYKENLFKNGREILKKAQVFKQVDIVDIVVNEAIKYLFETSTGGALKPSLNALLSDGFKDASKAYAKEFVNLIYKAKRGLLDIDSSKWGLDNSEQQGQQTTIKEIKELLRVVNKKGKEYKKIVDLAVREFLKFRDFDEYKKRRKEALLSGNPTMIKVFEVINFLTIYFNEFYLNSKLNEKFYGYSSKKITDLCTTHCNFNKIKDDFVYSVKNQCLFWQMYNVNFINSFKSLAEVLVESLVKAHVINPLEREPSSVRNKNKISPSFSRHIKRILKR